MSASLPERLHERIRAEYREMPGMRLKPEQVQRLFDIERTECQMVLDSLVEAKFLWASSDGHYGRTTDGGTFRPRAAKADFRPERRFLRAS
jgi:hypothetical protein